MTVPPAIRSGINSVSDLVRSMIPRLRYRLTPEEQDLALHLRSNDALCKSLYDVIDSRIAGRASMPVPSNPTDCLVSLTRDNELRWLLSRLEFLRRSPAAQPADIDGEHPE